MAKPKYEHLCRSCRFLGKDNAKLDEETGSVDMYAHDCGTHYVLYRRYGNDDEDFNYTTFSPFNMSTEIHVAWLPLIRKISN